jgi:hypothetical protein
VNPIRSFLSAGTEAAARARLALCSALFAGHAWWLACVAEDSYISFRFARHLAAGHGFRWNLGEPPVEGFTNLLWVVLAALVELLGLDVVRTLQAAGVAAGVGVLWLVDRFGARVLGLTGAARAVPALLLAASGPLATWAASGLETVPFALFVLAAGYGAARFWQGGEGRALALAWIAAALATLTRPEGVLVAGVAGLAGLARRERRGRGWLAAGLFAAFLLALTLARLAYFGAPLPNTFYAKTGGGLLQAARGAVYSGFFAFHYLLPLAPLLIAGWIGKEKASGKGTTPVTALAAWTLGWTLGWTLYVVAVGGDYMAMYRFFVPVVPALALLAGVAAARLRPGPAAAGLTSRKSWASCSSTTRSATSGWRTKKTARPGSSASSSGGERRPGPTSTTGPIGGPRGAEDRSRSPRADPVGVAGERDTASRGAGRFSTEDEPGGGIWSV